LGSLNHVVGKFGRSAQFCGVRMSTGDQAKDKPIAPPATESTEDLATFSLHDLCQRIYLVRSAAVGTEQGDSDSIE